MNAFGGVSRLRIVAVLAGAVMLVGCASTGASLATRDPGYKRADADYVSAVEHLALRRGVRVVWINPPYETGKDYTRQVR
jgi:hypothetical protein